MQVQRAHMRCPGSIRVHAVCLFPSGLLDQCHLKSTEQLSDAVLECMRSPNSIVVFSGCGTSGRLACLCAQAFNLILNQAEHGKSNRYAPVFQYLVAGGDAALVMSQESVEDDPHAGILDLTTLVEQTKAGMANVAQVVVCSQYIGRISQCIHASLLCCYCTDKPCIVSLLPLRACLVRGHHVRAQRSLCWWCVMFPCSQPADLVSHPSSSHDLRVNVIPHLSTQVNCTLRPMTRVFAPA